MKILLGREEVNPDLRDILGRTPLSFAAQDGLEAVVKILLWGEEVNANQQDNDGQTPLKGAVRYGHRRVVALLHSVEVVTERLLKRKETRTN